MKLQFEAAPGNKSDQEFLAAVHHLSRLGVDVRLEAGVNNLELATANYDGKDPNPSQAAEITMTVKEIGKHLVGATLVKMSYAGEDSEFYIGPNAERNTRSAMLRKAAYYAGLAGERDIAAALRGKAGH